MKIEFFHIFIAAVALFAIVKSFTIDWGAPLTALDMAMFSSLPWAMGIAVLFYALMVEIYMVKIQHNSDVSIPICTLIKEGHLAFITFVLVGPNLGETAK